MKTKNKKNIAHPLNQLATALFGIALLQASAAQAQGVGIASMGATGGLQIPSAYVLGSGEMALSFGDYQNPKLGDFSRHQNFTLGFGVLPGVELFGRFAEYTNPNKDADGARNANGPRDISANIKWQLPIDLPGLPKLAIGASDLSGGAVYFKSQYAVASDQYGPLRWSLGYARGTPSLGRIGNPKVLDGLFGGGELKLGTSRATLLAESDGTQRHAGLRYYSDQISWLGDSQLVGTVQRSFGATTFSGQAADSTNFNVSLILPMGTSDAKRQAKANASKPLPALSVLPAMSDLSTADAGMSATAADRMDDLARLLRSIGLDRIRIGMLGQQLVVEYENYRYLHNEADALGLVLGLAVETAPAGTSRVHAITRKVGQIVLETSVDALAYQAFLRDGDASLVRSSMGSGRLPGYDDSGVQWAQGNAGAGSRKSWLRLQIRPLLNYTLGTEYGAFDYSLAAQLRSTVGLWRGAELYTDVVQRVSNSRNVEPAGIFASSRQTNGLQTVALQQSFWLGERSFTSVGAGRYNYTDRGAEGESILFLPWNDDSLHVRGSYMQHQADVLPRVLEAYSGSYRWRMNTTTWLEAGYQQYTDRSTGPSVAFTRWFGDVALQLFARKGGSATFVGLSLTVPLTPREGMGAGLIQVSGNPSYTQSIRTQRTSALVTGNFIANDAVRPVALNYQPEVELLNSGRIAPSYIKDQLQRMRESFYLFGRDKLN
ncbi:hypothetical protein HC248_01072 [Polaromonas vacuolata]|uniref:Exopolysaccharide biosynthesis protein YbjH n=1 Tax=Polaromonas vacuolata TaxID=37448 RepID=A0A6H2H7E9_9BURK|nr:YjbH domain-containing protein [Polaromonas vacuolata]QJC55789.1 hypothetical protein HC248_01072 [Polaromonas vacuolata]